MLRRPVPVAGHQIVDEAVGDVRREECEELGGASRGKFESIGLRATPNKPLRPMFLDTLIYLSQGLDSQAFMSNSLTPSN